MIRTPPTLTLEIHDSVAFLTLARPEAANTTNLEFGREGIAAFLEKRTPRFQ